MDWNAIETFFEHRIWGTLTIGIITGLIVSLILFLLGRLNKRYRVYRLMLKESTENTVNSSLENEEFFQLVKAQHENFGFLTLFGLLSAIVVLVAEKDFAYYEIVSNILIAMSLTALIYKLKYMWLIGKIHGANMKRRIDVLKAERDKKVSD